MKVVMDMEYLVSNGCINYERIGEGSPLFILHGMGTDHRAMKAWMEPIFDNVTGWERIYIDLPAHGGSKINENVRTSDDLLDNIIEFIDNIMKPNERFSLVGMSFGGYLAQGIMNRKRESVNAICLLAPVLHIKERTLPKKVIMEKDHELLDRLDPQMRIAFETLTVYQNAVTLERFQSEIQPGRSLANQEFLASDWREKGYFLSEAPFGDVNEVTQSALIILGKLDYICGYLDHFTLLEKYTHASFSVLDHAGHMLQLEKRECVQELMGEWLQRTIQ